jgi:uncharacterized protein with HEPN domain
MKPRDSASLLDIAKSARLSIEFVKGMSQTEFVSDVPYSWWIWAS